MKTPAIIRSITLRFWRLAYGKPMNTSERSPVGSHHPHKCQSLPEWWITTPFHRTLLSWASLVTLVVIWQDSNRQCPSLRATFPYHFGEPLNSCIFKVCAHTGLGEQDVNIIAYTGISNLTWITTNSFSCGLGPFAWAMVLQNADDEESLVLLGKFFHCSSLLKRRYTWRAFLTSRLRCDLPQSSGHKGKYHRE